MVEREELLFCPFCGAVPVLDVNYNGTDTTYGIHCPNCHCASIETGTYTKQEAITLWNRRLEPAGEPLTIEELKQMNDEPVFIEDIENNGRASCWAIIGKQIAEGVELHDKFCDRHYVDFGAFELYGKTWLAYRHKPKKGVNNFDGGLQSNVVLCPKCKYACFSKTIEYAYVCKNKSSPCHNRITASDFGCVYGQKKEIEADV